MSLLTSEGHQRQPKGMTRASPVGWTSGLIGIFFQAHGWEIEAHRSMGDPETAVSPNSLTQHGWQFLHGSIDGISLLLIFHSLCTSISRDYIQPGQSQTNGKRARGDVRSLWGKVNNPPQLLLSPSPSSLSRQPLKYPCLESPVHTVYPRMALNCWSLPARFFHLSVNYPFYSVAQLWGS